jgi:hypothetical protein
MKGGGGLFLKLAPPIKQPPLVLFGLWDGSWCAVDPPQGRFVAVRFRCVKLGGGLAGSKFPCTPKPGCPGPNLNSGLSQ